MFTFLKKWFRNIIKNTGKDYNKTLESFGDTLAKEIEWSSIARSGSFFKTRNLSKNSSGDFVFYPSLMAILFPLPFMGMGGYIIYRFVLDKFPVINLLYHPIYSLRFFFHQLIQAGFSGVLLGFLFGFIFFMVGAVALIFAVRPIIFNAREQMYYKGFLHKKGISFRDIYAIQLISDLGSGADSDTNYELNLVLKSKERVNVLAHAKEQVIRQDADQLSQLLSVPVWDMM